MPFILGERRTRELLLTGDTIDAPTALQWGLANRVVAADELEAEVDRFAARIAPTPLEVLRLTKLALNRATRAMGLLEAVEANLDLSARAQLRQHAGAAGVRSDVREEGLKAALAWRDRRYGEILSALGRKEEE